MKKILFLLIFLNSCLIVSAQNYNVSKRSIRKALEVEIMDVSGEKHNGYLWYADSSKIIISKNDLSDKSLQVFFHHDIYKIQTKKKSNFLKTALGSYLVTSYLSGIFFIHVSPYGMDYKGLTYILSAILIGTPASIADGIILRNICVEKMDFEVNSDYKKFEKGVEYLQNNNFSNEKYNKLDLKYKDVKRDETYLEKLEPPLKMFHPEYYSRFHFEMSTPFLKSDNVLIQSNNFSNLNFDSGYEKLFNYPTNYSFGLNINKKIRSFFAISTVFDYFESGSRREILDDTISIVDYVSTHLKFSTYTLGAEYLFTCVENNMLNKHELSLGLGVTNYKVKHESGIYNIVNYEPFKIQRNTKFYKYNTQGLKLTANQSLSIMSNLIVGLKILNPHVR